MASKSVFLEDIAATLTYAPPEGTPTGSPTVTVYESDGTTLIASTAATISGSSLTLALTATHTADKGRDYRARWVYVVGSTTYRADQLFDVVSHVLRPTLTTTKLGYYYPDLTDRLWSGVASYQNQITAAWDDYVLQGIEALGKDPHRIMDGYQIEPAHAAYTLYLIGRAMGPDESWQRWSQERLKEGSDLLQRALSAVVWYDEDQDLAPNSAEQAEPIWQIELRR